MSLESEGKRSKWTSEEDELLSQLVSRYGTQQWSKIAQSFPGRKPKQCRERYTNYLDPRLSQAPWTEEEKRIVLEAHKQVGNAWSKIARLLSGRSENSVKNLFYSVQRRQMNKRSASDLVTSSQENIPAYSPLLHPFVSEDRNHFGNKTENFIESSDMPALSSSGFHSFSLISDSDLCSLPSAPYSFVPNFSVPDIDDLNINQVSSSPLSGTIPAQHSPILGLSHGETLPPTRFFSGRNPTFHSYTVRDSLEEPAKVASSSSMISSDDGGNEGCDTSLSVSRPLIPLSEVIQATPVFSREVFKVPPSNELSSQCPTSLSSASSSSSSNGGLVNEVIQYVQKLNNDDAVSMLFQVREEIDSLLRNRGIDPTNRLETNHPRSQLSDDNHSDNVWSESYFEADLPLPPVDQTLERWSCIGRDMHSNFASEDSESALRLMHNSSSMIHVDLDHSLTSWPIVSMEEPENLRATTGAFPSAVVELPCSNTTRSSSTSTSSSSSSTSEDSINASNYDADKRRNFYLSVPVNEISLPRVLLIESSPSFTCDVFVGPSIGVNLDIEDWGSSRSSISRGSLCASAGDLSIQSASIHTRGEQIIEGWCLGIHGSIQRPLAYVSSSTSITIRVSRGEQLIRPPESVQFSVSPEAVAAVRRLPRHQSLTFAAQLQLSCRESERGELELENAPEYLVIVCSAIDPECLVLTNVLLFVPSETFPVLVDSSNSVVDSIL